MDKCVNDAVRFQRANKYNINITKDYIDQSQTHSELCDKYFFSSSYTPWGVACIEAAFLDRMSFPNIWDSKNIIRKDILSNAHLHLNIKDRLLQAFEVSDWQKWYDSFYILKIKNSLDKELYNKELYKEIKNNTYLSEKSRENLLCNINNILEEQQNESTRHMPTSS